MDKTFIASITWKEFTDAINSKTVIVVPDGSADTAFQGCVQTINQDIKKITDTGVMGDPTAASVDKGELIVKPVSDYVSAFIQKFRNLTVE